ncbi:hypothetical protein AGDE_17112 [Angomonas deanei]|uniref:Uncharacterized protein n=1 Tax=Angomonas deanei TaxID=59799 RepID=A0A7G2CKD2_9TRYP|nr:hypothetical protein AGDE_17112 [Angomonas deanei]CAD2219859.1 hypothetical protein, conserved [Angomonas deanei]|eukprot:EPY15454.1 hypothetical protein AGDE_17112 [Angomonas deanei]
MERCFGRNTFGTSGVACFRLPFGTSPVPSTDLREVKSVPAPFCLRLRLFCGGVSARLRHHAPSGSLRLYPSAFVPAFFANAVPGSRGSASPKAVPLFHAGPSVLRKGAENNARASLSLFQALPVLVRTKRSRQSPAAPGAFFYWRTNWREGVIDILPVEVGPAPVCKQRGNPGGSAGAAWGWGGVKQSVAPQGDRRLPWAWVCGAAFRAPRKRRSGGESARLRLRGERASRPPKTL